MRSFCICDAGKVDDAAGLCRREGFGIELHTFYRPERCRDTDLLARHRERVLCFNDDIQGRDTDFLAHHREAVRGITDVSIHGPFWGLNAGSHDPEER